MGLWVFWPLFGALIGLAAAQKRGFSIAAGVLGGLLLGPLAVLMYAVTGVAERGEATGTKKCPFCANTIKVEAIVCQHCHRDLPEADAQRQEQEAQRRKEAYLAEIRSKRPQRPA